MITSTIRNPTEDEKNKQLKLLPNAYHRFESFILTFICIMGISITPLLMYDHYRPVESIIQGIYCIIACVASLVISYWLRQKLDGDFSYNKQVAKIQSLQVEAVKVKTQRAIKREDYEDFGSAYYIEVTDNGQPKTLYLWGQYLDELAYKNLFPSTEFEFIRNIGSNVFIEFKITGHYFREEKILPPFPKEVWKKGIYPANGQLLDQVIDNYIIE